MSIWEKSFPQKRYIWYKAHIQLYATPLINVTFTKNSVGSSCIADILQNIEKRKPKWFQDIVCKLLTIETEQISHLIHPTLLCMVDD